MIGSLNIYPKDLNLTFNEEDELVKSVVNFLGHRRRNKFTFPLLISLYSFIFATGLTGNLCKLNSFSFLSYLKNKSSFLKVHVLPFGKVEICIHQRIFIYFHWLFPIFC
jgi:hypothetical protein